MTVGIVNDYFLDLDMSSVSVGSIQNRILARSLTWALAYNRSPPIGANMIPTTKKRGKTVLGVRIGLRQSVLAGVVRKRYLALRTTYCQAFNRCCRKAVSRMGRNLSDDDASFQIPQVELTRRSPALCFLMHLIVLLTVY